MPDQTSTDQPNAQSSQAEARARFPQRFAGKTVLVTGAGTGFGAEVAVRAAQEGADVAVHYRSSEAGARQTVARVEAEGRKAFLVQADIVDWAQVSRMADAVWDHFG